MQSRQCVWETSNHLLSHQGSVPLSQVWDLHLLLESIICSTLGETFWIRGISSWLFFSIVFSGPARLNPLDFQVVKNEESPLRPFLICILTFCCVGPQATDFMDLFHQRQAKLHMKRCHFSTFLFPPTIGVKFLSHWLVWELQTAAFHWSASMFFQLIIICLQMLPEAKRPAELAKPWVRKPSLWTILSACRVPVLMEQSNADWRHAHAQPSIWLNTKTYWHSKC